MAVEIGERYVRRHTPTRSGFSNTTAADVTYDNEEINDGSGWTYSAPAVETDTAGLYLIAYDLGQVQQASTRAVGTLIPRINGASDLTTHPATHRYLRNSGGSMGASIGFTIRNLSASDDVRVRNPGNTLASVDALGTFGTQSGNGGALQVIRLPDGNFTHVRRIDPAAEVGTSNINTTRPWVDSSGTWTKITFQSELADDDNLWSSGGDVTLRANTKYLILWNVVASSTDSSRHTYVTALNINGDRVQTGSGYQRTTASQGPPMTGMYLYEPGGVDETAYLECTHETEGGDAGTPNIQQAHLQILELPSSAEWVHADNGATDSLTTALAGTGTWYETPLSSTQRTDGDSNLSLDSANNAIQNDSGGSLPVLAIGWHRWDRDSGSSGTRKMPWAQFNNGGTRIGYGVAGAYSRGQQGADDTFQAHYCSAATLDLANGADLTYEVNEPASGSNSDMGIYASASRHFLGVQVLNLNSLDASGTDATATPAAIAGSASLGATATGGTGATATPAAIAGTATLGASASGTTSIDATATPGAIDGSASVNTGAVVNSTVGDLVIFGSTLVGATATAATTLDGDATPAAISGSASLGATATGDGVATPLSVDGSATLGASATGGTAATATPASIDGVATLGATAVGENNATASPAAIGGTATLGATATGEGNATATPAAIVGTAVLGATASSGSGATAAPAAIDGSATLGATASAGSGATATPTAIAGSASLGATATGGADVSATPAAIAGSTTLGATATGDGTATPAAINGSAQVDASAVAGGNAIASPAAIAATTTILIGVQYLLDENDEQILDENDEPLLAENSGTIATGTAVATPGALNGSTTLGATASGGAEATATPAAIEATSTLGATATGGADAVASPAAISGTVTLGAAATGGAASTAMPGAINGSATLGATATGDGAATPAAISGSATLGATAIGETASVDATATPAAITGSTTLASDFAAGALVVPDGIFITTQVSASGESTETLFYYYTPTTPSGRVPLKRSWKEFRRDLTPAQVTHGQMGLAVLKEAGEYRTVRTPSNAELEAADAYYLGGRQNTVTGTEKDLIEASGVGGTFEAIT